MITLQRKDDLKSVLEKFVPIGKKLWSFDNRPKYDNTYEIYVMPMDYDPEVDIAEKIEIDFDEEFLSPGGHHFTICDLHMDIDAFTKRGGHFVNDLAFSCDTVHTLIDTILELENQLEMEKRKDKK